MKKLLILGVLIILPIYAISQDLTIRFQFDSSVLDYSSIKSISGFITENNPNKLVLQGFADTIGTKDYNKHLVDRRLEFVEKIIQSQYPEIEIEKINNGEEKSHSGDAKNRKVELYLSDLVFQLKAPNYKEAHSFFVDNKKDTVIECKEGTKILIPNNSFITKSIKEKPTGIIELRVAEYYTVHEMIDANLTTQSNDDILETGGMLFIQAYSDKSECILDNGKQIGLVFKNISEKDSMRLFSGIESENSVNWEPINTEQVEESELAVFIIVENMPTFQGGGISVFRDYVNSRLRYPAIAAEKGIQGRVMVHFTIDVTGLVVNPKVIRGVDPSLDFEALRAVSSSPRWTPGTQRGQPVPVQFTIPINFELDGSLPIDESNRILTQSDFEYYIENDSVIQKRKETNEFVSEFYMWTNKLNWINCDKYYRFPNKSDIKILVNSEYESYYALLNQNRSIMRPNAFYQDKKIRGFNNVPSNQEVLIVGIRIVNEETYFTSFKAKPNGITYETDFKKIDKNGLIKEMKMIGL